VGKGGFIFFSHARADAERLQVLLDNLYGAGFTVFVDRQMPVGLRWETMLDEKIAAARCLLVVWSEASVASPQVAREVDLALRLGKPVVAVRVDRVVPPERFADQNVADLHQWHGHGAYPEWLKVIAFLRQLGVPEKSSAWRAAVLQWNKGNPTPSQIESPGGGPKVRTIVIRVRSLAELQVRVASLMKEGFGTVEEEEGLHILQKEHIYKRRLHVLLYCLGIMPGIIYSMIRERLPAKEIVKVIVIEGGP
jgi:hypothetical protein